MEEVNTHWAYIFTFFPWPQNISIKGKFILPFFFEAVLVYFVLFIISRAISGYIWLTFFSNLGKLDGENKLKVFCRVL